MKVWELCGNTVIDVNDSYGARMIEQGKAVIPPEDEPQEDQETPAEETTEEAEAPARATKGAKKK